MGDFAETDSASPRIPDPLREYRLRCRDQVAHPGMTKPGRFEAICASLFVVEQHPADRSEALRCARRQFLDYVFAINRLTSSESATLVSCRKPRRGVASCCSRIPINAETNSSEWRRGSDEPAARKARSALCRHASNHSATIGR